MDESTLSEIPPRPFVAAPDPSRYFPANSVEEARKRVSRCVVRGEGPALVIGGAGTGKSLLLEVLSEQFRDKLAVALLDGAQLCTRRALLQSILFQFDLPYRELDEGELRLSLRDFLLPAEKVPVKLLLLVDEADNLPTRLLEELRALTNLTSQGENLVRLVLVGSSILEERFAEPELSVFSQRIAVRSYLTPFGREETFQYIRAQVTETDHDPERLFTEDGLEAMFVATDGVPRLINQLGDQLVWLCQETGYKPIDGAIVQQAWSDLQQLPAPWNFAPQETEEGVVEFGELSHMGKEESEEADDECPASIPIRVQSDYETSGDEKNLMDSFDATEELIDQFEQLEGLPPQVVKLETEEPETRNPFAEDFDNEEVVIDQYVSFESQLLATAQQVSNRTDSIFSQQLKSFESHSMHDSSQGSGSSNSKDEIEPVNPREEPASVTTTDLATDTRSLWETTEKRKEDGVSEPEWHEVKNPTRSAEQVKERTSCVSRELLVVEDETPPAPSIVPGKKFRQLFATLEANTEASRLG